MAVSWTAMLRKHHGILIDSEICKSIFKAFHQSSQQIICVKSLPILSSSSLNEVYILRTVLSNHNNHNIHPNILSLLSIKYLPSLSIKNSTYFIFDYAYNRDLASHGLLYGGTEKQLDKEQIRTYLYQLLSAIIYCHDRLVYHCAIELKHLLITRTGQLKLSNFEYAKHAVWPTMAIDIRDLSCFSQCPPELLLGDRTLRDSLDMWSVGCVFAQLCSSTQIESLFRGNHQIELLFCIFSMMGTPTHDIWPLFRKHPYFNVDFPRWLRRNDQLYDLTKVIGAEGLDFLKCLLTYDPKQRLTARTALQHQYFNR
ncbi:unnamed protein product [Rotaria magnacalcarata]|uniref:cyclin-dependent kinase n=1 Tax=Rotaria magnacalcarata TaxID=392030 RepID=A0A816PJ30_9BILA|nr:unnamed protein product [Rotaria magnacalcarata]CAF1373314.1 unnamed protein product [Rotaria magnacalcarata]CAF2048691.1 unnamed protein product [Rotaria magnacalcarata]CAF2110201.1 unnamed protein product [Rotaria magnacalcarata]CAF2133967.1 unnamed protein product [Rotaria magnacalcarata]